MYNSIIFIHLQMASLPLQYMMALQSHLLREIVLYAPPEYSNATIRSKCEATLQLMQNRIIKFAKKLFAGTEEAFF